MPNNIAKPFIKWAGGKTQLINEIKDILPESLKNSPFTYIEPFVGSGAVLFWMLQEFPNMERAIINDVNKDLTDCYKTIKEDVEGIINILSVWQDEYYDIYEKDELKKEYYYQKRSLFNERSSSLQVQSALFIFLNKTCFNGLYRVNKKNGFNVPIGKSTSLPPICRPENLRATASALKKVIILNGDYSDTIQHATGNTFFYFDPPYKPLSKSSSFNSYAKDVFDDCQQIRLKEFCERLNDLGHKWILSNSDMKNIDPENNFFDDLYADFNINRVFARRSINADETKRGKLTELLITN